MDRTASKRRSLLPGALLLAAVALTGCDPAKGGDEARPRAADAAPASAQNVVIAVPIVADVGRLERVRESTVPRPMWMTDRREKAGVTPQRVKVLATRVKVAPAFPCTSVEQVTGAPLRLR